LDAAAVRFHFWHLLFSCDPASKRQRQQLQEMIGQLKINDEIVTNGGVIGRIKEIKETSFIVQSAEKSFLEIGKSAVVGRRPEN
jgi:preprotein translocase subunit YajC